MRPVLSSEVLLVLIMSIESKIEDVLKLMKSDEQPTLNLLIEFAKNKPAICTNDRILEHKISGCSADAWLVCRKKNGLIELQTDSESMIVKGIMGLMEQVYSGSTPDEIISHPPVFLQSLGINQHLSANRRIGIGKVWGEIKDFTLNLASANP
jgi:cysteine desulfuration protein SufE